MTPMTTPTAPSLTDVCEKCHAPYKYRQDEHQTWIRFCDNCALDLARRPATPLPDSGSRTQFPTGAVRDAMVGKGFPSDIPPCFTRRLAQHYENGARKYSRGNWRLGMRLSRYQDAIERHTLSAAEGLTDEDHLAAIAFNVAGWMWTLEEIKAGRLPKELNDLPYWKAE